MNLADPKWGRRFLRLAIEVSSWSKDSTQVGTVIVSPGGLVISTGYNGIPRGVEDRAERLERPTKYLWIAHSEEAAIANAARHGSQTEGASLFCTHAPCSRCARQIINAGISRVIYGAGTTSMPREEFEAAAIMFGEAGVEVDAVRAEDPEPF
jgi:dCMP deaminase